MLESILAWVAVVLLLATSTGLLINRDWRWDIGFLSMQYLSVAILVAQHWPLGMAAVKLVTGWMATAALGMTLNALPPHEEAVEQFWPKGRAFRFFMVGMIVILAVSAAPRIESATPGLGLPVIIGAILLSGIGLLHLGTTSQIERVIFALLTVLAGFEILYAAIEGSILVAALLVVVNLGLGLVGAYLMNASEPEETA
ncbi:MAG TPA: hypothetical protein VHM28_08625 [Anaerolineales bacterium]|jgi:hypothetical protein|nr:hypothetical protein [Anaerolineales bacterium]